MTVAVFAGLSQRVGYRAPYGSQSLRLQHNCFFTMHWTIDWFRSAHSKDRPIGRIASWRMPVSESVSAPGEERSHTTKTHLPEPVERRTLRPLIMHRRLVSGHAGFTHDLGPASDLAINVCTELLGGGSFDHDPRVGEFLGKHWILHSGMDH